MRLGRGQLRLYALTDRRWTPPDALCRQVERALWGGATMIQLREKGLAPDAFLREAVEVRALCRQWGVPMIVNDSVSVAQAAGADGVHLGLEDMDIAAARSILGPDRIIGASAHTLEEARRAEALGADYLGVGAIFPTRTKTDVVSTGLDTLREICAGASIPVVAIGGISLEVLDQLAGTGIAGVAVSSGLFSQPDVTGTAGWFRARLADILDR